MTAWKKNILCAKNKIRTKLNHSLIWCLFHFLYSWQMFLLKISHLEKHSTEKCLFDIKFSKINPGNILLWTQFAKPNPAILNPVKFNPALINPLKVSFQRSQASISFGFTSSPFSWKILIVLLCRSLFLTDLGIPASSNLSAFPTRAFEDVSTLVYN